MEFDEPLVCIALKFEIKNAREYEILCPLDVDFHNNVVAVSLLAQLQAHQP